MFPFLCSTFALLFSSPLPSSPSYWAYVSWPLDIFLFILKTTKFWPLDIVFLFILYVLPSSSFLPTEKKNLRYVRNLHFWGVSPFSFFKTAFYSKLCDINIWQLLFYNMALNGIGHLIYLNKMNHPNKTWTKLLRTFLKLSICHTSNLYYFSKIQS